jgi:hypothetical protein
MVQSTSVTDIQDSIQIFPTTPGDRPGTNSADGSIPPMKAAEDVVEAVWAAYAMIPFPVIAWSQEGRTWFLSWSYGLRETSLFFINR